MAFDNPLQKKKLIRTIIVSSRDVPMELDSYKEKKCFSKFCANSTITEKKVYDKNAFL